MKRCRMCKVEKPVAEFFKDRSKPDGVSNRCKRCNVAHAAKYLKANPVRRWKYELERNYGLTEADYDRISEQQKNVCAICGAEPTSRQRGLKKLFVDHCHRTKQVRGLLCAHCNTGLGYFRDRLDSLQNAIRYLRRPTSKAPQERTG